MTKFFVALQKNPRLGVYVDPDATVGATIGTNLRLPDGSIPTLAQLAAVLGGVSTTTVVNQSGTPQTFSSWNQIIGIPPNVTALADTATTGLYTITGDGSSATRSLTTGTLDIGNANGVAGDPSIDLAVLADSGAGSLLAFTRDTYGRVSGSRSATITGTTDRISVANGDASAGLPTIDIAATYAGQNSITTLGTVTTGTWAATDVGLAHGGTGASLAGPGADRIMFWDESLGAVTWLEAGSGLSISGTTITATGTGGTVTSVALDMPASIFDVSGSPITGAGTLTVTLDNQAANTVFAGPTTGAAAAPTFRSLVAADIPDLSGTYQPLDATLTAFAALTIAADSLTIGTGADAFSQTTFAANTFPAKASTGNLVAKSISDFGLSLVDDADASTARSTLGLVIGTNVQAWDATLDTVAAWALTGTANSTTFLRGDGVFSNFLTGPIGIGVAPTTNYQIRANRGMTGSVSAWGISSEGAIQSDVTTQANLFTTGAQTAASAFTLPNLRHYTAIQGTFGAGSAVTTQTGFSARSSLTGGTNNYGLRGEIASGSGRFNLFNDGTADNAVAGNFSFGKTTAPAAKVDIAAGSATAGTAPLKFTSGTVLTAPVAGVMEYNNTPHFTNSDATRRHIVLAPNTTEVTAGAPYANSGYVVMNLGGTDFNVMVTAG